LLDEVITDRPSMPILSSMNSMPLAWQAAASSSLIAREASEMSVSPLQNVLKPSPVPGPSTATWTPGLAPLNFSATRELIGSTVEEPEILIEPASCCPPPDAAPPPSSLPPSGAGRRAPHADATY
jgi:hypothetical protein